VLYFKATFRNSLSNNWSIVLVQMVLYATVVLVAGQIKLWVGSETTVSHSKEVTPTEELTNNAREQLVNSISMVLLMFLRLESRKRGLLIDSIYI